MSALPDSGHSNSGKLSILNVCFRRQKKTKRPVRFEITARTRKSLEDWIAAANRRVRCASDRLVAVAHRLLEHARSELLESWYTYSEERSLIAIREWCDSEKLSVTE